MKAQVVSHAGAVGYTITLLSENETVIAQLLIAGCKLDPELVKRLGVRKASLLQLSEIARCVTDAINFHHDAHREME